MNYPMQILRLFLILFVCLCPKVFAQVATDIHFDAQVLDPGKGKMAVADLDADGLNDIVQRGSMDDESLTIYLYHPKKGFKTHTLLNDINFRGDRIDLQDIDNDGDLDLVTGLGILNADGKEVNHDVVWVENPLPKGKITNGKLWKIHRIGNQPGYIKDIAAADFDRDGRLDIVTREHERTAIYFQQPNNKWEKTIELDHESHEGMDIGDLDLDGDIDIVLNGFWFETPENARSETYKKHIFDPRWHTPVEGSWRDNNTAIKVADLNADGLPDILISHSELPGFPISMYYAASIEDVRGDRWREIQLAETYDFCQTLDVGDVDNDGDLDVLGAAFSRNPAEPNWMNAPPYPVSIFYNENGTGTSWREQQIESDGMYAGLLADLDSDGDVDVLGPRSYYEGPIKWWENTLTDQRFSLSDFSYIQIDDNRDRYVIPGASSWWSYFGLDMTDVNKDQYMDIISGEWYYRNPGGDMTEEWKRIRFPIEVDAMLAVDVDGDAYADVIGQRLPDVIWLEADDTEGNTWSFTKIGSMPQTGHANTQSYTTAQLIPGGREEIILGDAVGMHYFIIPDEPSNMPWQKRTITKDGQGYGTGDIDGDGLVDLIGGVRQEGEGPVLAGTRDVRKNNTMVSWWRNPGDASENWQHSTIGPGTFPDRFEVADMNGDGLLDVITSDERYPGNARNADLTWYEQQRNGASLSWPKHVVTTSKSMNSLDVADMDRDGDIDIVIGEHEMPGGDDVPLPKDEKVIVFENDGTGQFTPHTVDEGKESHLGAQLCDLDGDGDLDIVSIAWREPQYVHLWRNNAVNGHAAAETTRPWGRSYRLAIEVSANGTPRLDKPVEIPVNFTTNLKNTGRNSGFSPSSLKLVEVNAEGDIVDCQVPFQFEPAGNFDAQSRALGTLVFTLKGHTGIDEKRFYHLYFDGEDRHARVLENDIKIEEIGVYEGYPSYKITTPSADYYYHITCAGFASLVDRDGNDWISYHPNEEPDPGSQGRYRGIPNVAPIGYHPGTERDKKPSEIIASGPVRVSLLSVSDDEQWQVRYDIYSDYTTMTLLEKEEGVPYWILYEGTPGGTFESDDYWVRSDGTREQMKPYLMPENQWTGHLPSPKWVYFGDKDIDRVLYYVFHEDYGNKHEDVFWHFGDEGMTVFGFGRGPTRENWQQLDACPSHFTFGFAENNDFDAVERAVNSAYRPLKISVQEIEVSP